MKRIAFIALFSVLAILTLAQTDTSLTNRLKKTLEYTRNMDFHKILDYTYPKLFTIVTREQMVEVLKNTFETDDYTAELDSVEIDTIFPVFNINNDNYAKVRHSMLMRMKYKETFDTIDKDRLNMLISMMEMKFGTGNVRFDQMANTLHIFINADLVAIKDKISPQWTFVNLDEDNPALLNLLFRKEVLDKLKEFK